MCTFYHRERKVLAYFGQIMNDTFPEDCLIDLTAFWGASAHAEEALLLQGFLLLQVSFRGCKEVARAGTLFPEKWGGEIDVHSDLLRPERHIFQMGTVLVFEGEHFWNVEGYGMDRSAFGRCTMQHLRKPWDIIIFCFWWQWRRRESYDRMRRKWEKIEVQGDLFISQRAGNGNAKSEELLLLLHQLPTATNTKR